MDVLLDGFREMDDRFLSLLNLGEMHMRVSLNSRSKWIRLVRVIAIANIVPTQKYVTESGVKYYQTRQRFHGLDGGLPNGIRFEGSNKVYLGNGHHRLYVSRQRGRKSLRVVVWDVDMAHPSEDFIYYGKKYEGKQSA